MGKRIVIVGPAWPLRGGLSTYNERLCKAFNDAGHDCSILSFSLQYPSVLFPGKTQYSSDAAPENISIDTAINSVNPLNWLNVGNRYRKLAPDLMVFRYWMPFMAPALGSIARRVHKNGHTRLLAIADNIYPHEKHFYDQACTNYFVNSMDGFMTMSQSVLKDLQTLVPEKPSQYVPHPMYDNFGALQDKTAAKQALGLDPDKHYLLFFGFIRQYKGLDLLLKSFAASGLKDRNVCLLIAGEYYEDSAPYKALIKDLDLQHAVVERNDFIPNGEVATYFSACDMVVQTYHSATQSGVTQIAYHFNKPMLVTDVGGLAETVPHNEVGYVCAKDEHIIAAALNDFYDNARESAFSSHAQTFKQNFSWDKVMDALLGV